MKHEIVLKHEFVEFIPEEPEQGTLYISIRYKTGTHLCCCGCGNIVVTPISPTDWKLIFDGKTVSLHPSIGNWSFPCQSHYWIRNSGVTWASRWTREEIEHGRICDLHAKEDYFAKDDEVQAGTTKSKRRWWASIKKRLR